MIYKVPKYLIIKRNVLIQILQTPNGQLGVNEKYWIVPH